MQKKAFSWNFVVLLVFDFQNDCMYLPLKMFCFILIWYSNQTTYLSFILIQNIQANLCLDCLCLIQYVSFLNIIIVK